MAIGKLKVKKSVKALKGQALLHNAIVELLSKMKGENGVEVLVTEGGILIRGSGAGGGGGGYSEGGAVDAVNATGLLDKVVRHSTAATPTAYPTELRVVNGTKTITLDTDGLRLENSSDGSFIKLTFAGPNIEYYRNAPGSVHYAQMQSIDVCVDGVTQQMWFLRGDPY